MSQILGGVAVRACNPFASVVSCCISTRLQCSVGAVAVKPVYISRQLLSKPLICSPSVTTDKPTEDVVGSQIGRSTCSIELSFSFWESGTRCQPVGTDHMEYPNLNFLGPVGCRNIQEVFGDLSYFYDAFDTIDEAREIVTQCCSGAVEALLLEQAAQRLLEWKVEAKTDYERRKRLRITEFDSTLLIPAELGADALATDFEEVVNSNPEILLEISKRLVKKDKVQGSTQSRAEREEKDRVRHAMGLARVIQEAALPVSLRIDSLEKPDIGWQRAFGSRRAKTLRSRLRVWNKFRAWLNASYGAVWPKTSTVIINYVEELIQLECCPISLPRELVASLSLLEQVGMVPETMRLSNDSLLVSHLKSWDSMLRSGEAPRGPARPYTVAVLVAFQDVVNAAKCGIDA